MHFCGRTFDPRWPLGFCRSNGSYRHRRCTEGSQFDEPDHDAMHSQTRFRVLGDWIPLGSWMISPGDILLYVGIWGVVIGRVLRWLL
jgi:hypothetical protein